MPRPRGFRWVALSPPGQKVVGAGEKLYGCVLKYNPKNGIRLSFCFPRKTNKIEKQLSCSTLGSQHGQQRRQSSGAAMFFALTGTDTGDDEDCSDVS